MNPTMYFLKIYYDQIYFIQEIKGKLNITTIMYYSRKNQTIISMNIEKKN